MTTVRELPKHEWGRLANHPFLPKLPDPEMSRIVVAEEEGEIVGLWVLVQVVHVEPVWIAPSHRGKTLGGRMWAAVKGILDACLIHAAYCFADRPDTANYLQRLQFRPLPYQTFYYEAPPCQHPSSPPESWPEAGLPARR